jgi:hypothetical protein
MMGYDITRGVKGEKRDEPIPESSTRAQGEAILKKIALRVRKQIPAEVVKSVDVRFIEDNVARDFVFELQATLWGSHVTTIDWPRSLWQYIKRAIFPRFLLRRFPVKVESVRLDAVLLDVAEKLPPDHDLHLLWRHNGGLSGLYPWLTPREPEDEKVSDDESEA